MTLRDQQRKLTDRLNETRKTIESNIHEIVNKVQISKNVEKQIKNLQANLEKAMKLMMLSLNVASRDQIDFLNKRIDLLSEKLEKTSKKSKPAPKVKRPAARKAKSA